MASLVIASVWFIILIFALIILIKSADYLVSFAEKLGNKFNIHTFIIGATVVAFGTSLPELAVGITSILGGEPDIITGTVVGSSISNILLITGVAILLSTGFVIRFVNHRIEFLLLILSTILCACFLWDKSFKFIEALICLVLLAIYLVYVVWFSNKNFEPSKQNVIIIRKREYALFALSSFGVWLGAKYTIDAITNISQMLSLGSDVIAQTIVALGTSLPELAVTVTAARKKQFGIVLGNVIGSNIFNLLAVLAIPAMVGVWVEKPYFVYDDGFNQFAIPLMLGATFLLVLVSFFKVTPRSFGVLFLLLYIFFLVGSFLKINLFLFF